MNNARKLEILQLIKEHQITSEEGYQMLMNLKKDMISGQGKAGEEIAIVGLAGQFPGAKNVDEFWNRLIEDENLLIEVPKERWDLEQFYDPTPGKNQKTYCRKGGFLSNIDLFDPRFFNITDKEAEWMDPQQRLFLTECWNALEDAGYANDNISQNTCGVFVGVGQSDYQDRFKSGTIVAGPQSFWGNDTSVLASRISYYLNLKGISVAINTACSSSLVAIHLACNSIQSGECDMAIAGGVYVGNTPGFFLASSSANMLATRSECNAFDYRASGFVPGEAAAAIVLKSKKQAIIDGDHIYCIMKASKSGQDGRTNGITAPSAKSQSLLEEEVYRKANINPESICYVETHGTGTPLGDPIEFEALKRSFQKFTEKKNFCALGSVKVNIGHAATAAGVVSVIKSAMMLKHRTMLPYINFEKANPEIDFEDSPFYINKELKRMESFEGQQSRVAVSAFGFSGTNCHIVLESYERHKKINKGGSFLFLFSSNRKDGLIETVNKMLSALDQYRDDDLENISYTLCVRRKWFQQRCYFVASSCNELKAQMKNWLLNHAENDLGVTTECSVNDLIADYIQADQNSYDNRKTELLNKIGSYYLVGKGFSLKSIYSDCTCISLPTYSFHNKRYWIEEKDNRKAPSDTNNDKTNHASLKFYKRTWKQVELDKMEKYSDESKSAEIDYLLTDDLLKKPDIQARTVIDINTFTQTEFEKLLQQQSGKNKEVYNILFYINKGIDMHYESAIKISFESVIYVIQGLLRKSAKKANILFVMKEHDERNPYFYALEGLAKSIHMEEPELGMRVISMDNHCGERLVKILAEEFQDNAEHKNTTLVQYKNGLRHLYLLQEHTHNKEEAGRIKVNGCYLITGGMKGVGYQIADYLAKKYKAALILVGRTEYSDNTGTKFKEKLMQLEQLGSKVRYIQMDVSDSESCHSLVSKLKFNDLQLDGIFHCAGLSQDDMIQNKTRSQWDTVFAPKIKGTENVVQILGEITEDFIVLMSSTVSLFGSMGQADYVYGNSFMDFYASSLKKLKPRVISINAFYWENGGMKANQGLLQRMQNQYGLYAMNHVVGMQILEEAIHCNLSQLIGLYGNEKIVSALRSFMIDYEPEPKENRRKFESSYENMQNLNQKIEAFLKNLISKESGIPVDEIEANQGFDELGLDSIMITNMNTTIEEYFNDVPKSAFYEFTSIKEMANGLCSFYSDSKFELENSEYSKADNTTSIEKTLDVVIQTEEQQAAPDHAEVPAIIGMSGIFPESANLNEFWANLKSEKDCISEIPKERWDYKELLQGMPEHIRDSYCKYGGFIKDYDCFDPLFFNISPKEAEWMDPQERLFIQEVWHALEDAGYTRKSLSNKRVGVFAGLTNAHYQLYQTETEGQALSPLVTYASLANRVSYLFDFKGPSLTVDTMCSSFLTAMYYAVESIKNNECDICIVGSANLLLHEDKYTQLAISKFASIKGKCHSFGKNADGYVPGEGVGVVILKKLSQAVTDRDNIYGVMKGISINHGGKTNGYTVPSPKAQSEVIRSALKKSDINPCNISYIEAHGAGTLLGDPIEIDGLTKVFSEYSKETCYIPIGSVKSNIGHLEAAAAVAGLIKVLLQMKNNVLVKSLHSEAPNENIKFTKTPFYVQKETAFWDRKQINDTIVPRMSGISSFGAGGANGHMIIEEYIKEPLPEEYERDQLFLFSAMDEESLKNNVREMLHYLDDISRPTEKLSNQHIRETILSKIAKVFSVPVNMLNEEYVLGDYGFDQYKHAQLMEVFLECGYQIDYKEFELEAMTINELIQAIHGASSFSYVIKPRLQDISYTLQTGREALRHKIAIVAPDLDSLRTILKNWLAFGSGASCYTASKETLYCNGEPVQPNCNKSMDTLLNEENLPELALNWLLGKEINWNQLASNRTAKRVSLPGYMFRKEHYLIDRNAVQLKIERHNPVLGENVSGLDKCSYRVEFTGKEFFLHDHILLDKKVLPGMAYLELARANIEQVTKEKVIEISNILWGNRFSIDDKPKGMYLDLKREEPYITCNFVGDMNYSNCRAITSNDYPSSFYRDIDQIKQNCKNSITPVELYSYYKIGGLNYGPSFKMLDEVYYNETEALSHLTIPDCCYETFDYFVLHPSMLDASLQAGLCIRGDKAIKDDTTTHIPYYMEKISIFGKMERSCYSYITLAEEETDGVRKLNCDILSDDGRVLVKIQAFTARKVTSEKETKHTQLHYYKSQWHDMKALGSQTKLEKSLVVTESKIITSELQKRIKDGYYFNCKDNFLERLEEIPFTPKSILFDCRTTAKQVHITEEEIKTALEQTVFSLLLFLQAWNTVHGIKKVKLLVLTDGNWDVISAISKSVSGFVNSIRSNMPETEMVILENMGIDENHLTDSIDTLLSHKCMEKRYRVYPDGMKYMELCSCSHKPRKKSALMKNGTYLITGGLGAIGMIVAQYLVNNYKANLILTGRSDMNHEQEAFIKSLNEKSNSIIYFKGDISKYGDVQELQKQIKTSGYIPNGVFHTAGINSTGDWRNKTEQEFLATLRPKVYGTALLNDLCREWKVSFLLLFSSTSSLIGDFGRGDYAVANSFLDSFAEGQQELIWEKKSGVMTYVINWPIWEEGGMHTGSLDSEKQMLSRLGMTYIQTDQALECIENVLAGDEYQYIVMAGQRESINSIIEDSFLVAPNQKKSKNKENKKEQPILKTKRSKRTVIKNDRNMELKRIIGMLLNIDVERIDEDESIETYGFNSVTIAQLCADINKKYGTELNPTIFFEHNTVNKINSYLEKTLLPKLEILKSVTYERAIQTSGEIKDNEKLFLLAKKNMESASDLFLFLKNCSEQYNKKSNVYEIKDEQLYSKDYSKECDKETLLHMMVQLSSGQKIETMLWGEGDVLVIIPGFGISGAALMNQLMELSKRYRIVLIHLPGSGYSDGMTDILYPPRIAAVIKSTLEVLQIHQPVNLMAFSLGGLVAQELVKDYPNLCKQLILSCSFTRADSAETAEESLEKKFENDFTNTGNLEEFYEYYEMSKCVNRSSINYLAEASLKKYTEVDNLENVEIPVLVISGSKDAVVDKHESELIANRLNKSIHIEFMNHGHCVNLTNASDFNKIITEFIKKDGYLTNADIKELTLRDIIIRKNYTE